jgi:hypothetical protein
MAEEPEAPFDEMLPGIACPECAGGLRVSHRPSGRGLTWFECRLGHAFAAESLVPCKEDELERTLWAAVRLFDEIDVLHRALAGELRAVGEERRARGCERRAGRAHEHALVLQHTIEADGPVDE